MIIRYIVEIIKQFVEKGVIKISGISIDFTHSEANTFKAIPERVMERLVKKIVKTSDEENGKVPDSINPDIPEYIEIEDPKEAKATMKAFLEETITKVEGNVEIAR